MAGTQRACRSVAVIALLFTCFWVGGIDTAPGTLQGHAEAKENHYDAQLWDGFIPRSPLSEEGSMKTLVGTGQQRADGGPGDPGKSGVGAKRLRGLQIPVEIPMKRRLAAATRKLRTGNATYPSDPSDQFFRAPQGEEERLRGRLAALDRQLAHAKEATVDTDEESDEKVAVTSFSIGSAIFAAIALLCCGVCQGCCCCTSFFRYGNIFSEVFSWFSVGGIYQLLSDDENGTEDTIRKILRREARLMLVYPLLALAVSPSVDCDDGAPVWAYALFAPLLVRGKIIEFRILESLGEKSKVLSLAFVLGVLDILDFLTDGLFPVQVYKCEPQATSALVASFAESNVSFAAPLVASLRFWGVAAICLSAAILSQQASMEFGLGPDPEKMALAISADTAGFGAVGSLYGADQEGMSLLAVVVAKVMVEDLTQLWLQTTYVGIIFNRLSDAGRIKVMISLLIGLASAGYKCLKLLLSMTGRGGSGYFIPVPSVVVIGFLVLNAVKLYFTFSCSSHLWNMSSFSCASEAILNITNTSRSMMG